MNDTLKRKISIYLEMDPSKFNGHLATIHQKFDRLKSMGTAALSAIGISFGAMTAAAGLFLKSVIHAGTEAEKSIKTLEFSVTAHGMSWKKLGGILENYSKKTQLATAYSDELINQGLTRFIDIGANAQQAMGAMNTVLDFAAGRFIDVETSVNLLTKAYLGNTTMLTRMGIFIDDNLPKAAKWAAVQKAIAGFWDERAAQRVDTLAGKISLLGIAWDEFKEGVFDFLSKDNAFGNLLKVVTAFIQGLERGFRDAAPLMGIAFDKKALENYFTMGKKLAEELIAKLRELWSWLSTKGIEVWNGILDVIKKVWGVLEPMIEFAGKNADTILILYVGAKAVTLFTTLYGLLKAMSALTIIPLLTKLAGVAGAGAVGMYGGAAMIAGAAGYGLYKESERAGALPATERPTGTGFSTWVANRSGRRADEYDPMLAVQIPNGGMMASHGGVEPGVKGGKGISRKASGLETDTAYFNFMMEQFFDPIKKAYDTYMKDLAERLGAGRDAINQAETDADKVRFENSISKYDSYTQEKLRIDYDYQQKAVELMASGLELEDKVEIARIMAHKNMRDKEAVDDKKRQDKVAKQQELVYSWMTKIETNYVGQKISLGKLAAISAIDFIGMEFKAWVNTKLEQIALEAALAIASGQYWKAAKLTAVGALYSAGAALVSEGLRSITDDIIGNNNNNQTTAEAAAGLSNKSGPSVQGYSTRGVQNMFIAPSLSFTADTMIIGAGADLATAAKTIKDIAVEGVREAIDTGQIRLGN